MSPANQDSSSLCLHYLFAWDFSLTKSMFHKMLKTASVYGFVIWVSAWKAKNARLPQKEVHFLRQSQWLHFQEEAEGIMEEIVTHVVSNMRPFSHPPLLLLAQVIITAPNNLTNFPSSS